MEKAGHWGRGEPKQHSRQLAAHPAPGSASGTVVLPKLSLFSQASPSFPKCMLISEILKNTVKRQQHNHL